MFNEKLDPKILGQLLLMQSFIINLPNEKSVFSFVCKGLEDIPGVDKAIYKSTRELDNSPNVVSYTISSDQSYFGQIVFKLFDYEQYKPYENYLMNFAFMIGIVLEERKQFELNKQHNLVLEQKVEERTREVIREQERLMESQRRFTDLMKNVKLLSLILDVDGNIIFCNNYLLCLTRYSSEEVIGKNWFDMFLDEPVSRLVKANLNEAIRKEELANHYENDIITKTGERLFISWNNTVLRDDDGRIIGIASLGENITDRKHFQDALINKNLEYKRLNDEYSALNEKLNTNLENLKSINTQLELAKQKAEESDRLKTAFLQNMSHEIRTPMNAIVGFSSLLSSQYKNKNNLGKFCEIINQRSNDLLDIINDILDIAKIESGQLPLNMEVFNINDLFNELLEFFSDYRKRLGKENIKFSLKKHYSTDCNIYSDKVKLKQILINLISNAFKFTISGSIKGNCKIIDDKVLFYVKDTGVGIPYDKQQAVFERFIQLHNSEIQNSGGTGLGLSIVKGLVNILGGEIYLESEPGKGSTFSFTIPHKIPSDSRQLLKDEERSNR